MCAPLAECHRGQETAPHPVHTGDYSRRTVHTGYFSRRFRRRIRQLVAVYGAILPSVDGA